MEDLIGQTLGQYEIKEKIGQGGMAHVFKAYQPNLNRFVAVKVLSPVLANEPGFTERFQREALAVARLNHPNILPVFDSGTQDNYNYIVMRYVPNSITLNSLMQQDDITMDRLIEYMVQVADALDYAHQQGIIHRDIKPSNVLIDDRWALLADFGLVKDSESVSQLTGTGFGMGTPAYMSPEQARGIKVDHRTDIYALGIILHKILTNTIPHNANTPLAILAKRTTEPVIPIRHLKPDIPISLEQVTMRALAKEPDRRYSSAIGFGNALKKAYSDPDYREDITLPSTADLEATVATGPSIQEEATLAATTMLPPQPAAAQVPDQKSGNRRLLIGGGIAAVLIIGLLLWGMPYLFGRENGGESQPADLPETAVAAIPVAATESSPPTDTPAPPTDTPAPPADTPAPTLSGTPQAVIKMDLEVWNGPGDEYELLGYLATGAMVEIVSRDQSGDWWQIKIVLGSSGLGWISADEAASEATHAASVPIALAPPTPTPSPTHSPEPPTDTPAPTETDTPTSTATMAATDTPAVTASPTPSATATVPAGEIVLLKPASLEEPSFGPTEFEWQWSGPLPDDQGFEVRVWLDGEPASGVHDAVLDNKDGTVQRLDDSTFRLNAEISDAAGIRNRRGDYNWTVLLVQIEPEYKELGIQATPGQLRFEPPGGGGSSSGGGGGGLTGGE